VLLHQLEPSLVLLQQALLQEGATEIYIFQNLQLYIFKFAISHSSFYMQYVKDIDGIRTIYTN
jgi:hypothetical protein